MPKNVKRATRAAQETGSLTMRGVMRRRRLSYDAVSKLTKLSVTTLRSGVCRGFGPAVCWRIELGLGVALWCSHATFLKRLRQREILGADPILSNRSQLRRLAVEVGLPFWNSIPTRAKFVEKLFAHMEARAAVRRPVQPTPPASHD